MNWEKGVSITAYLGLRDYSARNASTSLIIFLTSWADVSIATLS